MRSPGVRAGLIALVMLIASTAAAVAAVSAPAGRKLTVTPAVGNPKSVFRVRIPSGSGVTSSSVLTVNLIGPAGRPGCIDGAPRGPEVSRLEGPDRVSLSVGSGSRWCVGSYSGTVRAVIRPTCTIGRACPQYIGIAEIGHFSFAVRARR